MKLVKEHINFERGLDPKDAMGTGRNAMSDEYKIDNHKEDERLKEDNKKLKKILIEKIKQIPDKYKLSMG